MPYLSPSYNYGSEVRNVNDQLYNQLNDSYTSTANIVNIKASVYRATSDPVANGQINANFSIGDLWVNTTSDTAWIMTSRTTSTAATWTQIT